MQKMIDEGAAIAAQKEGEIIDEISNESFNQPVGTANQKIALAVVQTAANHDVDVKVPDTEPTAKKPVAFHLDTASNPEAQNLPDTLDEADTLAASQALAEADTPAADSSEGGDGEKDKDYANRLKAAIEEEAIYESQSGGAGAAADGTESSAESSSITEAATSSKPAAAEKEAAPVSAAAIPKDNLETVAEAK